MSEPDNEPDWEIDALEIALLLDGVFRRYDADLRPYADAAIRHRVLRQLKVERLTTVSALQGKLLRDPACWLRFSDGFPGRRRGLFRGGAFYRHLRREVVPLLRTYPVVRVWMVGCATGEEAYAMAILLMEEGIYPRSRIYATDMDEAALAVAQAGCYPAAVTQGWAGAYHEAGGTGALSEFCQIDSGQAQFRPELGKNIIFARHSLVSDSSFNEFNLIVCRDVLNQFNPAVQARAYDLFHGSLGLFGVLAVGNREGFQAHVRHACYEVLPRIRHVFRRIR